MLLDAWTGELLDEATHPYRHGIMTASLPGGEPLPSNWALQDASDYVEAAEALLAALGRGRAVKGIGVGFTASSPMPATESGTPLSSEHPQEPHAYVKLWKHHAAQPWADRINARGGPYLANFGGKVSGEWLLPKAAQMAEEAPGLWSRASRFIESGDWIVWRLTGRETRSADFAAYKAQYSVKDGYPKDVVPGLIDKLERFPAGLNCAVFPTRWKCDSWGAPNRRRRGMGPLSVDLRKRVVSAVREEGMSCRAAAQRFGVSFSSAICWVAALRERGSYAPLPMGGDTRSQRVEAHTDFLLRLHRREPDLTLNEICDRLERARGEKVSPSMIWRFFDRHDITFKKSPRTRVSRAARTSLSGDGDGSTVNSISIR